MPEVADVEFFFYFRYEVVFLRINAISKDCQSTSLICNILFHLPVSVFGSIFDAHANINAAGKLERVVPQYRVII